MMKKTTKWILLLSVLLTGGGKWCNQACALTPVDGVYQIGSADELLEFAGIVNDGNNGANAVLTADIDMTDKAWTPIGNNDHRYIGTFDGQYHVIDNLKIENGGEKIGIFGVVNGGCVIKNLIAGPHNSIKGTQYVGGIVGCEDGSGWVTYENVGHEGYVEGTGVNCCAFIGVVFNGGPATRITNCYNTGNIKADSQSAIITGWFGGHGSVEVKGFYNTGSIEWGQDDENFLWRNSTGITTERIFNINANQGATIIGEGDLSSGKLAYNLNGKTDAGVWRQNLASDLRPTFNPSHSLVYGKQSYCDGIGKPDATEFVNDVAQKERDNHNYSNGICNNSHDNITCEEPNPDYLTPVNGCYEIDNVNELKWFAYYVNRQNNKINGKLTADIDFTSQSTMIGEPGHPYGGEFNGQGHTITVNYSCDESKGNEDECELALFRRINGGIVKNLKVEGTITTVNKLAGGIVSSIWEKGTIENCISAVTITDNEDHDGTHGGICARVKNRNGMVIIRNCAFVGEIQAEHTWGNGGIMGWPDGGGEYVKIQNCFVWGTLNMYTDSNDNDVIVRNSGVATNCFYLNTIGVKNSKEVTGVADMITLMNGLKPGWWKTASENYPRPWVTSNETIPTSLSSVADVIAFASSVACGNNEQNASLTSDIDYTDIDYFSGIGTATNRYKGIFDGNKHHISNLTMNRASEDGVGFFSYVTSGGTVIKRFTIDNTCSFSGNAGVGAFVGRAEGQNDNRDLLFEELGNEASVTASGKNAGAILGVDMNSDAIITVKNCYNTGTIIGQGGESGAFSGWFGNTPNIYNCYNIGTISDSQGSGLARANSYTCDNTYVIQNNQGGYHVLVNDDFVKNGTTDFQNGTVFASLFAYNDNGVDGSVWRMGTNHPVLYGNAIAMREDCTNRIVAGTYDVKLYRTIKDGTWNTFCAPFPVPTTQFLKVVELDTENGDTDFLHFKTFSGDMTAGKAYLVKTDSEITNMTFSDVTVSSTITSSTAGGYAFTGVYSPTPLPQDAYVFTTRKSDGADVIVKVNQGTNMNGFRAYLNAISPSRATGFVIDDEGTTGIITATGEVIENVNMYNLGGQRINEPQRGLYIVNGKKVLVK